MTKTITVSYSEIRDARACDFKHDLQWRHYYRKQHAETCECALCFGIAWHDVMEAYYQGLAGSYQWSDSSWHKNNGMTKGGWHAAVEQIGKTVPEHLQARIRWMVEGYAAVYGREAEWEVIATEKQYIVPLPQLVDDLEVLLKVKIDLILRDRKTRSLWVDDHKTCSQLPTQNKQIDPQLPLYMYALMECGERWPDPFGARYSYALKPCKTLKFRKEPPLEKRFRRRLVPHNRNEIYSVARDCYKTIYKRYFAAELFDKPERNTAPDVCGRCDFEVPCRAGRKGYDIKQFLADYNLVPYTDAPPKSPQEKE